jgi:hypothetical protein
MVNHKPKSSQSNPRFWIVVRTPVTLAAFTKRADALKFVVDEFGSIDAPHIEILGVTFKKRPLRSRETKP